MQKLALIGGEHIARYTVADRLWTLIADKTEQDFTFEVIPLETTKDLANFCEMYLDNPQFIGFNIATPWKNEVANYLPLPTKSGTYNTVFKRKGYLGGANTDPLGITKSLERFNALESTKNALVFGAGGAGKATAIYLAELGINVYLYDSAINRIENERLSLLNSLEAVQQRQYDLIINATPHGKYHLNEQISSFSTPIDNNMLKLVTKKDSTLQEMNYLPKLTLFLQLGINQGLRVVPGLHMLVYQAAESFKLYFGRSIEQHTISQIIQEMEEYIGSQEIICERKRD